MRNLLKADFYKIFKDKLFLTLCICIGSLSVVVPLIYLGVDRLAQIDGEEVVHIFGATDLFGVLFSSSSVAGMLIAIFSAIILNRDFKSGVIRNKLTAGKDRTTAYLAALIENLIIGIGFTVAFALIGFVIGLAFLPFSLKENYTVSTELLHLFFTLIINICVLAFHYTLITFFIYGAHSLALAIIIPYVVVNICNTYTSFASLLAVMKLSENPESSLIGFKVLEIMNFYGGKEALLSSILGNNYSVFALTEGVEYSVFDAYHIVGYTLIPLICAGLLNYLGIVIFRKKDLK